MKGYTDIEQSKKLAEILPFESADMCWELDKNCSIEAYNLVPLIRYSTKERKELFEKDKELIPCWSLSALLQLFPHDDTHGVELNNYCGANVRVWFVRGNYGFTFIRIKDEPIDGLVELILELKEKNLL